MTAPAATPADVARSMLFALIFYGGTIAAALLAPAIAMLGRRAIRGWGTAWVHFHGWCTRVLLRIERRVEGTIPDRPVLYAAKHQSMYETIELAAMLGSPSVLVKRELAQIPLWGWAAQRWGVIPVDRAGSAAALREMLRAGREAIDNGRPLLIFPEGTRVPVGEAPPLRSGFAGLYRMLEVDVVPIALDAGRLWPRQSFVKKAGVVTFRFGDVVPAGLPRRAAEAQVHAAINALEAGTSTPS
jgi:1-acyl-sn-glycerol-3-phosphate acyltransferase